MSITRRSLLGLFAGGLAAPLVTTWAKAAEAARFVNSSGLKPGGFIWQPSVAPEGSVLIVGSLREQTVHVYRNGLEIGISTCRTSARTPFGLFSIIDQHRDRSGRLHTSAGRLVWQAAATHAEGLEGVDGKVPLLRVPDDFAALLSAATERGAAVVIADERTATTVVEHNAGLFSSVPSEAAASLVNDIGRRIRRSPETAGTPGTEASIVVSRHDSKAYLIRAGMVEATTTVEIANPHIDLGTHVYGLIGPAADASALRWLAFGLSRSASAPHILREKASAVIVRLRFPESTMAMAMAGALGRGSTLYITDSAVTRSTRSARVDFEIIASRGAPSEGEPVRPGRHARSGAHIVDAVPASRVVPTRNPFEPY